MKTLKKQFQNSSLKVKIQLILFSCILFLFIVTFIGIYCVSNSFENALYHSASSSLSYSASNIESHLKQIDDLADSIFSDSLIQEQLPLLIETKIRAEKELYKNNIYNQIFNYLTSGTNMNDIPYISILQSENELVSTYSTESSKLSDKIRKTLYHTAKEANGKTVWITDYCQDYGIFLVKEMKKIKNLDFNSLGVLVINIDLQNLIFRTNGLSTKYEDPNYLLLENNHVFYHGKALSISDAQYLKEHLKQGYGIFSLGAKKVFAVRDRIPNYDWDYISVVSYESVANTVFITRNLCLLSIILAILFAFFASSRLLEAILYHIYYLIQKMKRVGNGNYELSEADLCYQNRFDEIGHLHTAFNSMTVKLDTLIRQNYTNELLKKEAQLKALESQMDPHFLYNTLDSINWRAKALEAEDIVQITTALGNLLRISLDRTHTPFTLAKEINLLENYMVIQKLRYPQRLNYTVEIPQECYNLQIPKFTIQPILENAIRYGLEEMSEICYISIRASIKETTLLIEVKNNGSSFEEHLLEKLETEEIQPHGFGIGLLNIHKRLLLAYGNDYGLRLINAEDELTGEEYAIVQIALPAILSETEEHISQSILNENAERKNPK